MTLDSSAPLEGVRVVDMCSDLGHLGSRFLGDLGADVICVETGPAGDPVHRATHHANKRSVTPETGLLWDLLAGADIVFEDSPPAGHPTSAVAPDRLCERFPHLVVVSVTPFGQSGPYRDWAATDAVHLAMSGMLSRSGLPGLDPIVPPGPLATESASIQAAWAALVAYVNRLDTGAGDHVDVSVFESAAQALDPGFGIGGSATGGVPAADGPRGRPDARHLYPIFPCADGWVRVCVLAPRQWQGMFAWLGEPAEFADPALGSLRNRFAAADRIHKAIAELFAGKTRAVITDEGRRYGVPTAALLDVADVLTAGHYAARGTFADAEINGRPARLPNGLVEIDGVRAGIRRPAPAPGHHNDDVRAELTGSLPVTRPRPGEPVPRRLPLDGIRVLDLGVIVVGAELGRLLADMGAEVVKVENKAFPDGSRQSMNGEPLTVSFAWGHRNKTSLGLNLRDPQGVELFKDLAAASDVVLSNFKPGTLESLGLGYDVLSEINPGIVMADSSAFGPTGPWSRRMGYGPLVRAESGLSGLWRYPDVEHGHSDASTIYPDHVAARVGATAVVALLLRRRRTGRGGTVSVAQAEVIIGQLADQFALESMAPGSVRAVGNALPGDAPRGVFPCAGDDEWCAVTVRDDTDFTALAHAIGRPDLVERYMTAAVREENRAMLDEALSQWTSARRPAQVAAELQAAGVPAGMMHRVPELLGDPHLVARGFYRTMRHPLLDGDIPAENHAARFEHVADAPLRPAPLPGEHTRAILRRVLGLDDQRMNELAAAGAIEEPMSAPVVLTERRGHVLIVTINRPEARNAVNLAVTLGLGDALREADDDRDVWAVIVTGAGDKAFCAGADLKAVARGEAIMPADEPRASWGFAGYVSHHISKPTIAAVNGYALGGGTEITLASDLAVAADTATFGLPEVKRGIYAGAGGVFRLPQQLPKKIAMELILTGEPLTAQRALELGLVNRVVPQADVLDAALDLAARVCANAPLAVQASKRVANGIIDGRVAADGPFWEANATEGALLMTTRDAAEGPRAFAEKRQPVWEAR